MIKEVEAFISKLPKKRSAGLTKAQDRYLKLKEELDEAYQKLDRSCTHCQTDVEVTTDTPEDTYGNVSNYKCVFSADKDA